MAGSPQYKAVHGVKSQLYSRGGSISDLQTEHVIKLVLHLPQANMNQGKDPKIQGPWARSSRASGHSYLGGAL